MDYNAINQLLQQKSQDYGQSQAKFATVEPTLRAQMFGNDDVTNNLNTQEKSKIDELFSHDQTVANQYKTPPAAGQIIDPYIRELQLTNRYRGTAGDLTDIRQNQQKRRDVIGDSLQNALKLAQQSLEMKKIELDQLSKDRDFAWEVYKEKNKGGSGGSSGQSTAQALFNSILGLQSKVQAAAPAKSGTTVQKVGQKGQTKATLMSQIQRQNPGSQVHYTFNKDGTISYSVVGKNQGYMEAPEANALDQAGGYEGMVKKLSAGAIANGAASSDISGMLQLLGLAGGGLDKPASGTSASSGNSTDDALGLFNGAGSGSTGGTIRVRLKSSGVTGTIPASEFNPKVYDKI